jgi:hypothetical protein
MRTRLTLLTYGALPLAVVIAGGVASIPLATAQSTIAASTTTATSTSSTTTTTTTSAKVLVKGVVSGAPESVSFSGQAQLSANVVTDPDFGTWPKVLLSIDLGGVTGTGSTTRTKYVIADQKTLTRTLAATDTVQATFPFYPSGGDPNSPRVGQATFSVSFDVNSLRLTGASGSIASP